MRRQAGGKVQVGLDGRDDDSRFDRDQIDTDDCQAHQRINDDPFVQHAVENVDHVRLAGYMLKGHSKFTYDA